MAEDVMALEREYLLSLLASPPANAASLSIADLHMLVMQQENPGPAPGQGGR